MQTQLAQLDDSVQTLQHRVMLLDMKRTMAWKQRYMDKVWRTAEAEDWQAVGWYLRQVHRLSEAVAEAGIDKSNGSISLCETAMLLPSFEPAFQALEASDRAAFLGRYRELVATCNACHAPKGRPTRASRSPWRRRRPGTSVSSAAHPIRASTDPILCAGRSLSRRPDAGSCRPPQSGPSDPDKVAEHWNDPEQETDR